MPETDIRCGSPPLGWCRDIRDPGSGLRRPQICHVTVWQSDYPIAAVASACRRQLTAAHHQPIRARFAFLSSPVIECVNIFTKAGRRPLLTRVAREPFSSHPLSSLVHPSNYGAGPWTTLELGMLTSVLAPLWL
ncbi:hypothetical protein BaRGS_00020574 [Batillaria attramentaria]|uniref:Uncharacterized protein n=1 Tax=Batillaria attramentaria TaxID=370345 RepID=A0ABD0KLW2_9CAEN